MAYSGRVEIFNKPIVIFSDCTAIPGLILTYFAIVYVMNQSGSNTTVYKQYVRGFPVLHDGYIIVVRGIAWPGIQ